MKRLALLVLGLVLCACSNTHKEQNASIQLVEIYPQVQMLLAKKAAGDEEGAKQIHDFLNKMANQHIIDDTISLITRASVSGYELILPSQLEAERDSFVIISTLPRGIYNLGFIPQAKHFEFALSPNLNENGSEWNWEADALSREMEDFVHLLGGDKDAKIVFYDSGEHIFAPMGSAHVGLMWARHLGYKNLYRLVGGFEAWKGLKLPISTEVPHCCEM